MRKSLLTVITAGMMALTTITSVFAQSPETILTVPAVVDARANAANVCATGTAEACNIALIAVTAAVQAAIAAANPNASVAAVNAAIYASFRAVVSDIRSTGASTANIPTIDATFATTVPEINTPPSVSPS